LRGFVYLLYVKALWDMLAEALLREKKIFTAVQKYSNTTNLCLEDSLLIFLFIMKNKIIAFVFYILNTIKKRGIKFIFIYFKEAILFDIINGTNTHFRVKKNEGIGVAQNVYNDGILYVASFTSVIVKTISISQKILGNLFYDSQFIDLGCGKGKTLLVYYKYYKNIITYPATGIEYDNILCRIAQKNIVKMDYSKEKIAVYCDSAINFEKYCKSEYYIVYLYNPFIGDTLLSVLSKLNKYPHLLIYVDPVEINILKNYNYYIHSRYKGVYNADTWVVAISEKLQNIIKFKNTSI